MKEVRNLFRPVGARLLMASLLVVPLAYLYLGPVEAYSGPSASGVAQGLRPSVETYYKDRPIPISAWNSRSGPPPWIEGTGSTSISPQSWKVVASRLQHNDAELMIAPAVVGRRWKEISSHEALLVVTYPKIGRMARREISKAGKILTDPEISRTPTRKVP